ncbi:MAG: carbohydrate kinase family protein [Candidatus Pacebacteria bacterium]|jgi:sugar/nucleoside kinase (ribokinase family)|nr:carbohydrate kinase family protein [Candidatus Paceibacterota bacterium]MDD3728872.1 carbohydrate kinase family protein [Candidatus Paceibacterota bacterium]MDD4467213.1 carbohydrate kinase family protein [Candidatus Paceibacterota bacterium]MDD5445756.1 carbohydrate kinase family protein [Candidatus Paceibacterota bacterium]
MFDIITFGSASRDTFLKSKNLKSATKKTLVTKEGIYLSLGSKIDVENIYHFTGGGGTNCAVTFANMGLKTAYFGKVGEDEAGEDILKELKQLKVNISLVKKTKEKKTNQSIVLNVKDKDRTILVYRGASEIMGKENIFLPLAKWLYFAPLSGKASLKFNSLVDYGIKKGMKIAANPGNSQLSLKNIKKIIKKIDILILNQEEASMLANVLYKDEKSALKRISEFYKGIIVITKGPLGSVVLNNSFLYEAKTLKSKVLDRTGAGDAFSSGFISEYIYSKDIVKSIQRGTANASSTIGFWGAKNGLLRKNQSFKKIKVKVSKF